MEKTLPVSAIKEGTVIDHISAGQALTIIRLLKLRESRNTVSVGLNLTSKRLGYKDLIKVANRFLTEKEAHDIAVFAPSATISIIRNFQVEKKIGATLPKIIQKILICPNARCITRAEQMETLFFVEEYKDEVHLRCKYCEKSFSRDEITEYSS